jgi:hypothetical protein
MGQRPRLSDVVPDHLLAEQFVGQLEIAGVPDAEGAEVTFYG